MAVAAELTADDVERERAQRTTLIQAVAAIATAARDHARDVRAPDGGARGGPQQARPVAGDADPVLGGRPLLPRGLARRAPRQHDDGHAGRRRDHRRLGLFDGRDAVARAGPVGAGIAARVLLRQLGHHHRPRPARAVARGPREGADHRGDPAAGRAPGDDGPPRPRRGRRGRRAGDGRRPATCCGSGPATRCRSTASSSTAPRPSTSPCSPASRSRSPSRPATRSSAPRSTRPGSFVMRATHVGRDTALARIVELVERAQGSKAPIQRLADRVSEVFVPLVLVIASLTFVAWMLVGPEPRFTLALTAFIGVVIIACPCAMGLATPTAIMVGTGKGAEAGILVRGGEALETAGRGRHRGLRQDRHPDARPAGGRRDVVPASGSAGGAARPRGLAREPAPSTRSARRSSAGRARASSASSRSTGSRPSSDAASRDGRRPGGRSSAAGG